ncbi:MAG: HEAT repeat domain-containing protein [Sphingomicrobium sp.]
MSALTLFWIVTWSISGLALAVLVGLVVYASWAKGRAATRKLEREHYIQLLKAGAEQAGGDAAMPADDVLTDLAVELLELVRGEEKTRFAERVARAGIVARLHARLSRGNVRTRVLAAVALANFNDQATQAALGKALDDRNPKVARIAALSLAALGVAPAPKDVFRRLRTREREASLLIVMLLVGMARSDVESVRMLLLDPDAPANLKAATAVALALCNDVAAVHAIAKLAMDADPAASELPRYLEALADIGHPAASPVVLHWLQSSSAQVRAAAARAAGRIGVEPALDRLEHLLGDPDWWVRFQAAQALLRFGKEGERRLKLAAARTDEPAHETASLMLAEHADAA